MVFPSSRKCEIRQQRNVYPTMLRPFAWSFRVSTLLHVASVCTACCMLLRVVLLGVVASVFTPLKHATLLAQQYWGLLRPFAP